MSNNIIYQLVIDDLQFVATETINRKLTPDEIETIASKIADRIDWYDTISMVISECRSLKTSIQMKVSCLID